MWFILTIHIERFGFDIVYLLSEDIQTKQISTCFLEWSCFSLCTGSLFKKFSSSFWQLMCTICRTCSPRWRSLRPVLSLCRTGWTAQRSEFRRAAPGYTTFQPRNRSSANCRYCGGRRHAVTLDLTPSRLFKQQISSQYSSQLIIAALLKLYYPCNYSVNEWVYLLQ